MSYAGSGTNALDRGVEALAYAQAAMPEVPARGAVGAAFRLDDDPAAQALPAGPARGRGVLCLRHVPDLECLPGDACEPRDGQSRDREAAPDARSCRWRWRCARSARDRRRRDSRRTSSRSASTTPPRLRSASGWSSIHTTAIVDFTGSARFGAWVEANAHPALCFSETSGVNTVVVESVETLEPVMQQSRDDDEPVLGADVHVAAERLRAARRDSSCGGRRIGADEFGAALATAIGSDRRRPEARRADHGGDPVAVHACADRRDGGGRRAPRQGAARLGPVRAR